MEIKAFTVADLKQELNSEEFWLTKTLPITKLRAISFCHNPRADRDDVVLLVAYQDSLVIGYLGILPDNIYTKNAEYKLGWLTSWWVDPARATTGVGAMLLFKALNAYNQQLGVSGASKEGRKALKASQRFMAFNSIKGLQVRLRFNLTAVILRKFPGMKLLRVLFKTIDAILNEIVNLRSFLWKRRCKNHLQLSYEYISCIDAETDDFMQRHHQQDLTRKGKAELNWMIQYPWIVSAPLKDSAGRRYYFSARANRFYFLGVKVFAPNHEMIGLFILKMRDDKASVVYSYFDGSHAPAIVAAVVHNTLAMDVSTLNLYDEKLVAAFSELSCPYWSTRSVSRGFLLSKALADIPAADSRLHGGDGDLAFY
jgi:hypothetical protein